MRKRVVARSRWLGGLAALWIGLGLVLIAPASHATPMVHRWQFDLSVDEITPNGFVDSHAIGQAWISYSPESDHLDILVSWTDLEGSIEKIHIHGPAPLGRNQRSHVVDIIKDPTEFPAPPTGLPDFWHNGRYETTLHLFDPPDSHADGHGGHYTPEQALEILISEDAYMLIHTSSYPEGEIRGQLRLTSVPEPSTALLLTLGTGLLAAARRIAR